MEKFMNYVERHDRDIYNMMCVTRDAIAYENKEEEFAAILRKSSISSLLPIELAEISAKKEYCADPIGVVRGFYRTYGDLSPRCNICLIFACHCAFGANIYETTERICKCICADRRCLASSIALVHIIQRIAFFNNSAAFLHEIIDESLNLAKIYLSAKEIIDFRENSEFLSVRLLFDVVACLKGKSPKTYFAKIIGGAIFTFIKK